jgi:hypothetical protein
VARLSAIPRIGPVTAAVVVAEIWDIHRFPSPERVCSWSGLTPSERSSDVHTRRGHISKQGSRWLRRVMVEVAARSDVHPTFRAFHDRIARRRGRKDRPGGPGSSGPHSLLVRPPRRGRLPCLPGRRVTVGLVEARSAHVMASVDGRLLD